MSYLKDRTGWPIQEGAFVHVHRTDLSSVRKGWVVKLPDESTVLEIQDEQGRTMYANTNEVELRPPTELQRARRKGITNASRDATEKLRRARKLMARRDVQ